MGNDIMIMKVDSVKLLFNDRVWIEIHFGKNPIRGGSPIMDIRFREIKVDLVGFDFLYSCLML